MKLLLENWRGYLNEAQGKTLGDYHDAFYGMMRDWQVPAEGFPKKEYRDLFYLKVGQWKSGEPRFKLSPKPLDGNPLKELIGKRVRATAETYPNSTRQPRIRAPGWYQSEERIPERYIPMTGQEATIESIYIWTKHKTGWKAYRGVHATLGLRWDEDVINQIIGIRDDGPCGLSSGSVYLWCLDPEGNKNRYGIELI